MATSETDSEYILPVQDANQSTPSAADLRGKIILGDSIVKQEIQAINELIRAAADTGQTRIAISTPAEASSGEESQLYKGITMAGNYNYGDWWCIEEIFQAGGIQRKVEGDERDEETSHYNGFTSVQRLGGVGALEGLYQKELFELIKSKLGNDCFIRHSRINSVLGHYRKLGYQIHPGNWFDATVNFKIKWVINWNNTIMDHIHMIDNTLIIGKLSNKVALGTVERDGSLDAAGTPNPVGNYADPQINSTKLEFFGMGNKGFGKISVFPADGKMGVTDDPSSPYYGTTNNVGYKLIGTALGAGDFAPTTDGGGTSAGLSAMYSLIGSLAAGVGSAIGDLTKTGLFTGEIGTLGGSDYTLHSGLRNTGDGVVPDEDNIDFYEANGRKSGSSGGSHGSAGGSSGGGGSHSGGGGGYTGPVPETPGSGTGNLVFDFVQTRLACPACGWWWDKGVLVVEGTGGTVSVRSAGRIFIKAARRDRAAFNVSASAVGSVRKATLYLYWNQREGLALRESGGTGYIAAGGKVIASLVSIRGRINGTGKGTGPLRIDATGYVRGRL